MVVAKEDGVSSNLLDIEVRGGEGVGNSPQRCSWLSGTLFLMVQMSVVEEGNINDVQEQVVIDH